MRISGLTVSSQSLFLIDSLKTAAVLKMINTLLVNDPTTFCSQVCLLTPLVLHIVLCRIRPRCPASIQYYEEKMAHHTVHGNLIGFCLFNSIFDVI